MKLYPRTSEVDKKEYYNALCPFKVQLPANLRRKIVEVTQDFIDASRTLRGEWGTSVLNCLDFHWNENQLKIIEANTNASGFLFSHLMESSEKSVISYEETLLRSFEICFDSKPKEVFIIDREPKAERMYVEFLMTQDFFERNGIKASILETERFNQLCTESSKSFYCYNRDTDFYLEQFPGILKKWKDGTLILSAHPRAYEAIASKKNLHELSELSDTSTTLRSALLRTIYLSEDTVENLWENRKKYFFKPLESFGGKGVYNGKSVSRKKFSEIAKEPYMAQEICPPGMYPHEDQDWKYDIRAFFSEEGVQKILCRLYQGQLTNFKSPGGGFALIEWI